MTWMVCSACRKAIAFGARHWVCSVSTCNRQRTRLVFCSVACWDSHLSMLRHREAWAVEATAPSQVEWAQAQSAPAPAQSAPAAPGPKATKATTTEEGDVLIVVSKMKKYIKEKSGMNCSDAVAEQLTAHVQAICDMAIANATKDGRKTVMDRDVPPLPQGAAPTDQAT